MVVADAVWAAAVSAEDILRTLVVPVERVVAVAGRRLLENHKIDANYIDSLVLFEEDKFSVSSSAQAIAVPPVATKSSTITTLSDSLTIVFF